jgi:hypothetical protein
MLTLRKFILSLVDRMNQDIGTDEEADENEALHRQLFHLRGMLWIPNRQHAALGSQRFIHQL